MSGNIKPDTVRTSAVKGGVAKQDSKLTKDVQETKQPEKSINLKDDPACYLGRSQVSSKNQTQTLNSASIQNIKNDIKNLNQNPKLAEKSDKLFNIAFEGLKAKNKTIDYPQAANLQIAFFKEFLK